jgi:small-conductance mechanosensitive channel/osmotically-inducible protein OsmY
MAMLFWNLSMQSRTLKTSSVQTSRDKGAARAHLRQAAAILAAVMLIETRPIWAQEPPIDAPAADTVGTAPATHPRPPEKVEVEPTARDADIRDRLLEILHATTWFTDPQVSVENGVVFLDGRTDDEQRKLWAGELVRNTEGVVAVVNRMEMTTPAALDFDPARQEFEAIVRGFVRALPLILVALAVLMLAWLGANMVKRLLLRILQSRVRSNLLLEVAARACAALVFLLGLYLVLRISGLSRLAVTVIGGTGLIGLVLGIAFRDITENFLASLVLSLQQPFREGDLVEVAGMMGYVQRLTSRTTVIMALDGNVVQVPNATVFKSVIRNYTSNPNWRQDFTIGIGYQDAIPHAQEVAMRVLSDHPAVLKQPEPWVLVDSLGASTVVLRVYFWLDVTQHSWLKVRSSVIRLIKRAYQDAGISLPDEAREVIFPDGVPVRMLDGEQTRVERREVRQTVQESSAVSTEAEGNLHAELDDIRQQARHAWSPDEGENLLSGSTTPATERGKRIATSPGNPRSVVADE